MCINIVSFGRWCKDNHLVVNVKKAKEMIFDFRKKKVVDPFNSPILLDGDAIEMVHSYRYLGTEIYDHLNWGEQNKSCVSEMQPQVVLPTQT